mgnify:CR=1 FL=1
MSQSGFYMQKKRRKRMEKMKENSCLLLLQDGRFLEMQFIDDCDFYTEGCDAAIDYTLYNRYHEEIDGGQMDYLSAKKNYGKIQEAVKDVLDFALDLRGKDLPKYYII